MYNVPYTNISKNVDCKNWFVMSLDRLKWKRSAKSGIPWNLFYDISPTIACSLLVTYMVFCGTLAPEGWVRWLSTKLSYREGRLSQALCLGVGQWERGTHMTECHSSSTLKNNYSCMDEILASCPLRYSTNSWCQFGCFHYDWNWLS